MLSETIFTKKVLPTLRPGLLPGSPTTLPNVPQPVSEAASVKLPEARSHRVLAGLEELQELSAAALYSGCWAPRCSQILFTESEPTWLVVSLSGAAPAAWTN